jgi:hypothetical protein
MPVDNEIITYLRNFQVSNCVKQVQDQALTSWKPQSKFISARFLAFARNFFKKNSTAYLYKPHPETFDHQNAFRWSCCKRSNRIGWNCFAQKQMFKEKSSDQHYLPGTDRFIAG